jgi:hypothetical protein
MNKTIQTLMLCTLITFGTACSNDAKTSEDSSPASTTTTVIIPEKSAEPEESKSKVKLNIGTNKDGKVSGDVDIEIKD